MFDATTFDTLMAHSDRGTTFHMDSNVFYPVREHINATFRFHGNVSPDLVIWTCLTCNSVGEATEAAGRDYHGFHTDFTHHGCQLPLVFTFTSTPFCNCADCKED